MNKDKPLETQWVVNKNNKCPVCKAGMALRTQNKVKQENNKYRKKCRSCDAEFIVDYSKNIIVKQIEGE